MASLTGARCARWERIIHLNETPNNQNFDAGVYGFIGIHLFTQIKLSEICIIHS